MKKSTLKEKSHSCENCGLAFSDDGRHTCYFTGRDVGAYNGACAPWCPLEEGEE